MGGLLSLLGRGGGDSTIPDVVFNPESKKAISNPTEDSQEEAWQAVQPAVAKLKQYFEYSSSLEEAIPELLKTLCEGDVRKNFEQNQSITKALADLFDFAFEFDYLKMKTPSIQNDFSYYRRTLSRGRLASETDLRTDMIEDELANRIALFYACPTPMLKTVTDASALFAKIKLSVKAIQTYSASEYSNLMSALRFNTKHLNDPSTPKNIKQLLANGN
ncbi:295_t:CDS:2 [Acaulospora colombiana]|uniref:295_t:CDS:1 n=1 Tax=Acaulospora colombiana TaxID=27376 RepID=A0ACA9LH41_9GLOM|nr:295_t:CDS:2 [Acaulospora colombiana]